jgi:hypothetical protein
MLSGRFEDRLPTRRRQIQFPSAPRDRTEREMDIAAIEFADHYVRFASHGGVAFPMHPP